tara:strand:- start:8 stop:148 length:141 start_codon:yes stop_codon:yes gene_type:complete
MNAADINIKIINAQDKMIKNLKKQIAHYKSIIKLINKEREVVNAKQ